MLSVAEYNAIIPQNICRVISEKGMKQDAVAKRAGLRGQDLSNMIHGRKIIKCADVIAIAGALQVGVSELFECDAGIRDRPNA